MTTRLRENHYHQLELIASYGKFGLAIHDPHFSRSGRALSDTLEKHGLVEYAPMLKGEVQWIFIPGNPTVYLLKTYQITRKGKRVLKKWLEKQSVHNAEIPF